MEIEETIADPSKAIYSISWDLMGTILSYTGGDNVVKIWKKNLQGKWTIIKELKQ